MTRARAALLPIAVVLVLCLGGTAEGAQTPIQARRHGRVLLFVVDHVSFEELLSVPEISRLARAGGAALMATNGRYRNDPRQVYEALGSGADHAPRLRALLARTLCAHGVGYGIDAGHTPRPTRLLGSEIGSLVGFPCSGSAGDLIIVEWISTAAQSEAATATGRRKAVLAGVGREIGREIRRHAIGRTMVAVVSPTPSADMIRRGDEISPVVLAVGPLDRLFRASGPMHALRSDTTRQTGLVVNVDVAPTILDFFGIPVPAKMDGQSIEPTDDPAPFHLHRLHLDQRRIRLPIQVAEVAFVAASGAVAIIVLLFQARRGYLPPRAAGTMRFIALCGAALPIPLILGGVLPRLTYWVVVPFVVLLVVALAAMASATRWPRPTGPLSFLGLVGLAVVVVDAMLGWRGARIPLLGGTMFDGARFYGLPNSFLALVLASALFVVAGLRAFPGFLLLVGAGLFVGFPSLGADIGGAITLFFAAGAWWVLRTRRRYGLKELAFVACITALGLGAVLLANRYLPGNPTHATRFVERTGGHLGTALHQFGSRLKVGFEQARKVPAAWIPLLGLPAVLGFVLARPGPIGWGLDLAGERWRHALIALTVAGIVAFFANDTGVAAAAPVFLYAMSGMAYPAFGAGERT